MLQQQNPNWAMMNLVLHLFYIPIARVGEKWWWWGVNSLTVWVRLEIMARNRVFSEQWWILYPSFLAYRQHGDERWVVTIKDCPMDAGNSLGYNGLAIDLSSSCDEHPFRCTLHIGSDALRTNKASRMIRDDTLVKASLTSRDGHFFPLLSHIDSGFPWDIACPMTFRTWSFLNEAAYKNITSEPLNKFQLCDFYSGYDHDLVWQLAEVILQQWCILTE